MYETGKGKGITYLAASILRRQASTCCVSACVGKDCPQIGQSPVCPLLAIFRPDIGFFFYVFIRSPPRSHGARDACPACGFDRFNVRSQGQSRHVFAARRGRKGAIGEADTYARHISFSNLVPLPSPCAQCGSARSVGSALRRNPFAPTVPCEFRLLLFAFIIERAALQMHSKPISRPVHMHACNSMQAIAW